MFWGLELEPAKKYTSTAEKNFHISMACLHPKQCHDDGYVSFLFRQNNTNFILCNLHKEKAIQVQLDLNFQKGDKVTFHTMGAKNTVFLSGYVLDDDEDDLDMDLDLDDEIASELQQPPSEVKRKKNQLVSSVKSKVPKLDLDGSDSTEDEEGSDDDDDDDDLDQEEEGDSENDVEDEDNSEEEDEDVEEEDTDSDEDSVGPAQIQAQIQKQFKKETPERKQPVTPVAQTNGRSPKSEKKKQQGNLTPGAKGTNTPTSGTPKRTLEGGVIVEDTKVGLGTPAKPGKMVTVYYVGRLKQTNKQFDASTQGSGFKFRLGRGEVIKGWDIGVNGMKIGGRRIITIPAPLAYGSKGSLPQIPPNAPLIFDVELKGVS